VVEGGGGRRAGRRSGAGSYIVVIFSRVSHFIVNGEFQHAIQPDAEHRLLFFPGVWCAAPVNFALCTVLSGVLNEL
jgi:hypothetical protein